MKPWSDHSHTVHTQAVAARWINGPVYRGIHCSSASSRYSHHTHINFMSQMKTAAWSTNTKRRQWMVSIQTS